jgi:superfamily II DNA or RNA helicase
VKPFRSGDRPRYDARGELLRADQVRRLLRGRYKDKVIQVDSSKTGAEEEEMIQSLLKVESTDEPTEIVIHVNMLKEGWDVTNLYTIVPLRAANARILIEQSIGRGLRLPYGKRTGVNGRGSPEHRRPRQVPGDHRRGQQARLGDPLAAMRSGRKRPRWCRNRNWPPNWA